MIGRAVFDNVGSCHRRRQGSEAIEVGLNSGCKRLEVAEPFVQKGVQQAEIDLQVTVNQHIAESGDIAEFARETVIENTEPPEFVDGAGIVRDIAAAAGRNVSRNVERVLGAELKASFHDPEQFSVGFELFEGDRAVSGKHLEREMPSERPDAV